MITSLFLLDDIINNNRHLKIKNKSLNYKVFKTNNSIVFKAVTPGFDKENISMKIDNNYLIVKGMTNDKCDLLNNEIHYKVYVGEDIDKNNINAELNKGILKIDMPIKESKKEYKIQF